MSTSPEQLGLREHELLEYDFACWLNFLGWECSRRNVVVCSSGTAALHLALEAFDLPPGSEVIVPDYTMVACARAVRLAGMTPVFVDCDDRLLMDPELAVGPQEAGAAAVMAVHVYGRRCDMNWKTTTETHHRIKVVEDLAEAHGLAPHPSTDAACWSFYRNKVIAGEEGGIVAFRDVDHADRARCLRNLGFINQQTYLHVPRGHNYRLADTLARIIRKGPDGMECYEGNLKRRRAAEAEYERVCPDEWKMPERDVPWVYDVRIPGLRPKDQSRAVGRLNQEGIAARCGFLPMSLQDEFLGSRRVHGEDHRARAAAREVVYLPLPPREPVRPETCFEALRSATS